MRLVDSSTCILLILLVLLIPCLTLDTDPLTSGQFTSTSITTSSWSLTFSSSRSTNSEIDKKFITTAVNKTPSRPPATNRGGSSRSGGGSSRSNTVLWCEEYGPSEPIDIQYCGITDPGTSRECDPGGDEPCCTRRETRGVCYGDKTFCTCKTCVDYRIVQALRTSETNCTATRIDDFLRTVCSDAENKTQYYFKCANSDVSYNIYMMCLILYLIDILLFSG